MEVMIGDRTLTAEEALRGGLVNHVFPVESYFDETLKIAAKIAAMPRVAARLTKEAVNKAFEMTLQEGLNYEKRLFYLLFGTEDKAEGMKAFVEKRAAQWTNR
jgi:enoyl-CoA hydratase